MEETKDPISSAYKKKKTTLTETKVLKLPEVKDEPLMEMVERASISIQ